MPINGLDHVNLRTTQLEVMIDWYVEVLGLRLGERPNFPFPGAWLYAGDRAIVHLVGIDGPPGHGSEAALKIEHFALSASGRAEFEAALERRGLEYRRAVIDEFRLVQVNLWDPDGNHIHVDFAADD